MGDELTREQIEALIEKSKDDRAIIVGSEIRQLGYLALSALRQRDGWVSVPMEPTGEMVSAGCRVDPVESIADVIKVYKDMLSAAPKSDERK